LFLSRQTHFAVSDIVQQFNANFDNLRQKASDRISLLESGNARLEKQLEEARATQVLIDAHIVCTTEHHS
jgi:hypothetical protein